MWGSRSAETHEHLREIHVPLSSSSKQFPWQSLAYPREKKKTEKKKNPIWAREDKSQNKSSSNTDRERLAEDKVTLHPQPSLLFLSRHAGPVCGENNNTKGYMGF